MNKQDLAANVMAALQDDDACTAVTNRSRRCVKVEKGKIWLVRFLPAKLGPNQIFFARVARHWVSNRPTVCPRYTAPDFGGSLEAFCPCCEISDTLRQSGDDWVNDQGFSFRAITQYLTWCVVFEKDGVQQLMSEVLNPYEFWHYKNSWEELKGFFRAGTRRTPLSVLDYREGNDFAVSKTSKGIRLDKQDSSPIFDPKDPKFNDYIQRLESAIHQPQIRIPTEKDLEILARKMEEIVERGGAEESETLERPAARSFSPPARQRASRGATGALDEDDAVAQPRSAQNSRRFAAKQENSGAASEEDDIPMHYPKVGDKTAAEEPAETSSDEDGDLALESAPERPLMSRPKSVKARMEAAASAPEEDSEEDQLPEETKDLAPPAPQLFDADAPPPTPARPGKMSEAIKNKIRSAVNRGA